MSGDLKLATFPPEAVALGNAPSQWIPVHAERISSFQVTEWDGLIEEEPGAGTTSFRVDADPRVFDSGVEIVTSYKRNTEVLECAENVALDGSGSGLSLDTVELIIDRVPKRLGWRTNVELRTLGDGSLDIQQTLVPVHGGDPQNRVKRKALLNDLPLAAVALSSLEVIQRPPYYTNIFVVRTMFQPPSDIKVFKTFGEDDSPTRHIDVKASEFMARLPDVEFLLRPTHIVVDEDNQLRGVLLPFHPASSLCFKLESLHPDIASAPPTLPPSGADRSSGSLAKTPMSVSWFVKLAWVIDVAASVAWLHAQSIFWGDLKLENIVLCIDGHCRFIDYAPGGLTTTWSPPEVAQFDLMAKQPARTPERDVFALGLILWAVAMEIGTFKRQEDYVCPQLMWNEDTPNWFQSLVLSCIDVEPSRRPLARRVYDALLTYTSPVQE
ncbi:kinase-like domain-containing protein [Mycena amicta]|nr:kinase-like domain-containing protein [Mycena amicta]